MIKLDFTIQSSEARQEFIQSEIEKSPDMKFRQSDLELIANYILYGKDSKDGKSVVDRKEVQIKTKYNSFNKKEPESLDSLLESPTFNESTTFKGSKPSYRLIKPSINREKDRDIPGIQQLWEIIDKIQYHVDVSRGKIVDPTVEPLSPSDLYKTRHLLIEIRREQFTLRDFYRPSLLPATNKAEFIPDPNFFDLPFDEENSDYGVAPLGLYSEHNEKFISPRTYKGTSTGFNSAAKFIIDFSNPDHIYTLLEHYEDLAVSSADSPASNAALLLKTLNFYIKKAELSESQSLILSLKVKKFPNESVRNVLDKRLSITHTANYISTIYKQQICTKIAEAAALHYDYFLNRFSPFNWKKCTCCGEWKLKDTREFVRKSRSSDGLSSRCKDCDKKDRQKDKNKPNKS